MKVGSHLGDLREVGVKEMQDPVGWQCFDLREANKDKRPVGAFVVQLAVLQNHQNGRDTHIRQVAWLSFTFVCSFTFYIHFARFAQRFCENSTLLLVLVIGKFWDALVFEIFCIC